MSHYVALFVIRVLRTTKKKKTTRSNVKFVQDLLLYSINRTSCWWWWTVWRSRDNDCRTNDVSRRRLSFRTRSIWRVKLEVSGVRRDRRPWCAARQWPNDIGPVSGDSGGSAIPRCLWSSVLSWTCGPSHRTARRSNYNFPEMKIIKYTMITKSVCINIFCKLYEFG